MCDPSFTHIVEFYYTVHCFIINVNYYRLNLLLIQKYWKQMNRFCLVVSDIRESLLTTGQPHLVNRPGVAGAVLQSPPLLIDSLTDWLSDPLVQISSNHCQSQTGKERTEILRECSSHTMCNVSYVTCHLPCVPCHVSPVTCNFFFFYSLKKLD